MGNEEIRKERSQKYFSDLTTKNTLAPNNPSQTLSEKVSLKITISNIETNYRYQIQLFNLENQNKIPLSDPEICTNDNSSNAICQKALLVQYLFEREQPILIEVVKSNESGPSRNYVVTTTLGCIMGSRKNTLQKQIQGISEMLIVQGGKMQQSEELLLLKFDITSNVPVVFSEIKNKIVFNLTTNTSKIYKSECINDMGKFNQVTIPCGLINDNINLTFYDCKQKVVADVKTNVQELINRKTFNINMSKRRIFKCVSSSRMTRNFTFIDYLQAGIQIGLSIAIDFTGSNGLPNIPTSLHNITGPEPNQYERAIYSCGNILAYYDYDQMFPCYGFGARINGQPVPIFNINFQSDPNIHTIPNIINAYHDSLSKVQLWGPTQFAPILRATISMIKGENDRLKYNILLILTDGMIDDVDDTINELVNGSFLPLSVIIIGVGKADFSTMNVLDADENPLLSSTGVKASRDLVQFVPFLKYEGNPERLAQEVLAEVPKQIIEYYTQNDLDPIKLCT